MSFSVLLLLILAFPTESVSLRGFDPTSCFDSNDSLEATDPEFSLDSLTEKKVTKHCDIVNV